MTKPKKSSPKTKTVPLPPHLDVKMWVYCEGDADEVFDKFDGSMCFYVSKDEALEDAGRNCSYDFTLFEVSLKLPGTEYEFKPVPKK